MRWNHISFFDYSSSLLLLFNKKMCDARFKRPKERKREREKGERLHKGGERYGEKPWSKQGCLVFKGEKSVYKHPCYCHHHHHHHVFSSSCCGSLTIIHCHNFCFFLSLTVSFSLNLITMAPSSCSFS